MPTIILICKMNEFPILILVAFFAINSLDKTESVQLEETPLNPIDEIFGEGWWDNEKDEEWNKLTLEQNALHKIDRQNTQIGLIELNSTEQLEQIEPNSTEQLEQIEPNSTEQLEQIEPNSTDQPEQSEPNSTDQLEQIEPNSTDQPEQSEPNSTDQNPPLTESDHSDNAKIDEEENEIIKEISSNKKLKIDKFHAMKKELKQKGKYSTKERTKIENEIAKHLKVNRSKIYKWKKEFGLSRKVFNEKEERKHLVEKFDQMKAELMRAGFKNSHQNEINKTVATELGITDRTIYNWKSELGHTERQHKYSHSQQKELMKRYYQIKDQNPKMSVGDIAKMLKIGTATLYTWKKQFNSVDENFVEENAAANVQEIGNSNSESI